MPKKISGKVQWGQMNTYQHLTPAELHSLLAEAEKHSTRNWLMLLTIYLHGLRVSELLSLTRENIQGETLVIQRLKNGYLNVQPLHESEAALLHELVLATAPGKRLFGLCRQQVYRIMRNYAEMIGLPPQKCHPHCLRHSVAMHSIDTVGIHRVRQMLGHRSISSTGHYLRSSDKEAADAVFSCLKIERKG